MDNYYACGTYSIVWYRLLLSLIWIIIVSSMDIHYVWHGKLFCLECRIVGLISGVDNYFAYCRKLLVCLLKIMSGIQSAG